MCFVTNLNTGITVEYDSFSKAVEVVEQIIGKVIEVNFKNYDNRFIFTMFSPFKKERKFSIMYYRM